MAAHGSLPLSLTVLPAALSGTTMWYVPAWRASPWLPKKNAHQGRQRGSGLGAQGVKRSQREIFLQEFFFCLLITSGNTQLTLAPHSRIIPGGARGPCGVLGIELGWLYARQAPSPLYSGSNAWRSPFPMGLRGDSPLPMPRSIPQHNHSCTELTSAYGILRSSSGQGRVTSLNQQP